MSDTTTAPPEHGPTTALVVVDVQHDFADPGGSLYVSGGEAIIEGINGEIAAARGAGGTVVLTQDWHPERTPHFIDQGGQWPPHCVAGTWGAALHERLSRDADMILRKGTSGEDGYSAFTVADPVSRETAPTGLQAYLQARGITAVVITGLALDVCVKATAIDAARAGMRTAVLTPLTRPVELQPGDGEAATAEMAAAGVAIVGG